jgi:UDP:flavonoid glycosyltransferase YjiC (YdhE family)
VLTDSACRDNAARLGDEMAALPGLEHGVALLERLAAEKAPMLPVPYSSAVDQSAPL